MLIEVFHIFIGFGQRIFFFLKLNEMGEVRWDKAIGENIKREGGMVKYLIFPISKRLFFGWQGFFSNDVKKGFWLFLRLTD